jgi:ATP-dependent Clp protease adaptor protein ClpS
MGSRFFHSAWYGGQTILAQKSSAAVAEPAEDTAIKPRVKERQKPKRQPRYHVILWDDDDHTYEYVIRMMKELFAHSTERGFQIAKEVDTAGRAICLTTTKEHAELKRDQIHAYGKDSLISRCKGSMYATIEPEMGSGD